MAQYFVRNTKKIGITVVTFNHEDIANYAIRLTTITKRGITTTAVSVPVISFRHKSNQCVLDVIDGLKLAAKYIEKIRGGHTAIRLSGGEAVYNDGNIIAQVFANHENPKVTLTKESDGFYRWKIGGYFSGENDAPGLIRMAGTINNVRLKAEEVLK
mgnify:CR=1 FL=1